MAISDRVLALCVAVEKEIKSRRRSGVLLVDPVVGRTRFDARAWDLRSGLDVLGQAVAQCQPAGSEMLPG